MRLIRLLLFALMMMTAACSLEPTTPASPPTDSVPPATEAGQTLSCPDLVSTALENLDRLCDETGRNQVCFGNRRIELEARSGSSPAGFSTPGDRVSLLDIARISLSPMNIEVGEWGFAIMKAQANLPDTLPGQNVTFLLFGGTDLDVEPAQDGIQAFTLQSGIGSGATCAEAPADGVLVQTPSEDVTVSFRMNGVDIELGSTAWLQAEPSVALRVSVIEGQALVTAQGVSEAVPAGTRTDVVLDAAGNAAGIPAPAEAYTLDEVRALPILPLDRPIQIAPPAQVSGRSDAVEVGAIIADALSQPGEVDTYSVIARVGQTIFVDGQNSDVSGNIAMRLIAPDGSNIMANRWAGSDFGPVALEQSGIYTLTINGSGTSAIGNYQVQLWDVPPPDTFTTQVGAVLAGGIETPGRSDQHSFEGKRGQTIFVDGQNGDVSGNIAMRLTAPDGSEIMANRWAGSDYGPAALEQSGIYTLTINGSGTSATGNYQVQLWDVPPPDTFSTQIGAVLAGGIETPGRRDLYSFEGKRGQTIFVDGQNGDVSGNIAMSLTAPDGSEIMANRWVGSDYGSLYLEQNGTYILTITGSGTSAIGNYQIQLWDVPAEETVTLSFQQVQRGSGSLTATARGEIRIPGELDRFIFDARAGQTLTITGQNTRVSGSISLLLRAPSGVELISSRWVGSRLDPLALTESGSYELLIHANHTSDVGAYVLEFLLESSGR